jgi:hypothetical protein
VSGLEVLALVLALFLLSQLVAIPLGATIGKRVSAARWFLIVVATLTLGFVGILIVGDRP